MSQAYQVTDLDVISYLIANTVVLLTINEKAHEVTTGITGQHSWAEYISEVI